MQSIEDVRNAILTVGHAVGHEAQADEVVRKLDADLDAAARAVPPGPRPKVVFVVDRGAGLKDISVVGPGGYIDELLRRAGADNAFGQAAARYSVVSPQEIVTAQPDVILDAMHTEDAAEAAKAQQDWDVLTSVPAVKNHRVILLSDPMFVTPGPRLGEALRRLVALIHGSP